MTQISTEEKLDVISRTESGERIVDICLNVRFAHICVCTFRDNADGIKESVKYLDDIKCEQSATGTICLCSKTTTVISE
jgi:hypothetical protein